MRPDGSEIAEIGWFDPRDLPHPLTHSARIVRDALHGEYGLVREDVIIDG
jgi:hypothetical protein